MDSFTNLFWQLDSTTKTNEKVSMLKSYLEVSKPSDAAWAVYFLTGRRIKRLVSTKLLRMWAQEEAGISAWLFEECYERVGDLAETISLVVPYSDTTSSLSLSELIEDVLLPMRKKEESEQRQVVVRLWSQMDQMQLFVIGKLLTGAFRVGVSMRLVQRAIAEQFGLDVPTIAHRMMGEWQPSAEFFEQLTQDSGGEIVASKPYPFFLANPLKSEPAELGECSEWLAEWKWDGIRAQLIRRSDETYLWSRGEELVTPQFPEVASAAKFLPNGTVIDGELVGWDAQNQCPMEFNQLQRRLGRKKIGKKLLEDVPVAMLAFDLLEWDGSDFRQRPLVDRRAKLVEALGNAGIDASSQDELLPFENSPTPLPVIRMSPAIDVNSWEEFAELRVKESKIHRAEGLMLKRNSSAYQVNRPVGDWWKWKVDPFTVDAVLLYAQRGHGRRANLYTDYTFAVWKDGSLVPFAKAYSGLTDEEIRRVDAFVRRNTQEKFGPVRSVKPELVFELAFENIQRSSRHKSGVAVRFPRIARWRLDKTIQDADSLETIVSLLEAK